MARGLPCRSAAVRDLVPKFLQPLNIRTCCGPEGRAPILREHWFCLQQVREPVYNQLNAMKASCGIVCGGGWSKREDHRIKFKAVCCLVLIAPAIYASGELADVIGMWSFILPAGF